jgi:hypothetical protein
MGLNAAVAFRFPVIRCKRETKDRANWQDADEARIHCKRANGCFPVFSC